MNLRRRHLRAFSLMELILAMSMMAMLAMSLYASMHSAIRAKRTAVAAVAPMRAATIAMDMICRDLESVPAPTGLLAGPFLATRQTSGTGEAAYLQFYCYGSDGNDPRAPVRDGVRMVELMLRSDLTPPVLERRITRNLLASTQEQPEEEILCRGVRSFAVQYSDGDYWQTEWDSTTVGDVLPMAVQILLEMEPPAGSAPDAQPVRIMRVIPLACAKPIDLTGEDGSTGDTSGSTGGTGGGQ